MATLEQLMAEMGLADAPKEQTKTASAKSSTDEVNQVLENLGLTAQALESADQVTKTASEERKNMGLSDIYAEIFGEEAAPAAAEAAAELQTKTASAEPSTADETPEGAFASLTGVYYSEMEGAMLDKVATDLEAEAGAGHDPMPEHASGQLTSVIGKAKDPHVAVNYKPNADQKLETNTKNNSPYTFASVQQYLKRIGGKAALVGGYKD